MEQAVGMPTAIMERRRKRRKIEEAVTGGYGSESEEAFESRQERTAEERIHGTEAIQSRDQVPASSSPHQVRSPAATGGGWFVDRCRIARREEAGDVEVVGTGEWAVVGEGGLVISARERCGGGTGRRATWHAVPRVDSWSPRGARLLCRSAGAPPGPTPHSLSGVVLEYYEQKIACKKWE